MTTDHRFNPFGKATKQIQTSDLGCLKQVTEGWYVEYKREVVNAKAIAKSISAFANTYGGWLFYGIDEESKENSVAGSFPGVENGALDQELQKIRQAVANSMNPACHYECITLAGPCPELELPEGRSIIVIEVPESKKAPHIHSSGVIYRRVSDGSEPLPEKDRYSIESLFEKSKKIATSYEDWHDTDPEFSEIEESVTYVRLMIQPNLWESPNTEFQLTTSKIRQIFGKAKGKISFINYDTIYPSASGVIARHCGTNDHNLYGLTWHIYRDLSGDIIIPINKYSGSRLEIASHLARYNFAESFLSRIATDNGTNVKVADLNALFNIITSIVELQRSIQTEAGWDSGFFIKTKLLNAWRTVPFLDIAHFANNIQLHGLPMCLRKTVTSPPGSAPTTFRKIGTYPECDYRDEVTLQSTFILSPIAEAYGITFNDFILNQEEDAEPFFIQLRSAGNRSKLPN